MSANSSFWVCVVPNRDRYHQSVRAALVKDGWIIKDDPLHLKWGKRDLYVDLSAERLLVAEGASHLCEWGGGGGQVPPTKPAPLAQMGRKR
jgi:hypothetical protein